MKRSDFNFEMNNGSLYGNKLTREEERKMYKVWQKMMHVAEVESAAVEEKVNKGKNKEKKSAE